MGALGLDSFLIAHQTYPRRQYWAIVNTLASVAMPGYAGVRMRLLQSPRSAMGEPFAASRSVVRDALQAQPDQRRNIDSLARYVAARPVAWDTRRIICWSAH